MTSGSMWLIAVALLFGPMAAEAQVQPVLQRGYDANVSGATLTETTLNSSNVGVNTFGLLFELAVDEKVYAQPLYVPNVAIPGLGSHNVLYVATMNDTLYAFDADVGGAPLWSVNLASLVGATAPIWANVAIPPATPVGHLGILSTPVIDPSTDIMYVVACTLEGSAMAYRLHAIDITTGSEPYGPGVLITGGYGGITFETPYVVQKASLVLADNQVVFGFSAMSQEYPLNYAGWVLAYNKQTLQQSGAFASVTTGNLQGGVWQSGRPAAVDSSGDVYVFTGNTSKGGWNGSIDFSESALKLDPSNGLALVDWFTAGNWQYLDDNDLDLSGSGPLLIPGTSLLTGGGKSGDLYVLDSTNLGHWTATDSQVVQSENITAGGEIRGGPVYWEGSATTGGPLMYDWGSGDVLKAFSFNGNTFSTSPIAQGAYTAVQPGGFLSLSANGNVPGSALLWANTPVNSAATPPLPPILHAFNAEDITQELWNSTMNTARDGGGSFSHGVPPMVANGKAYMATGSNQVAVYGILPYTISPTSLAFGNVQTNKASAARSVTVTNVSNAAVPITSISFSGSNPSAYSQTTTCGTSIPVGSACTISVVFMSAVAGSLPETLNVNGGSGAGTQPVTLTGTAVAPTYTVSPTSLAFGNVQTKTTSAPQTVTVTNGGSAALPITDITLTGASASLFSQTNTCGTSVPAGSKCTISVVFTPTSAGSKAATLNVVGGNRTGTQSVTLTGTAVAPTYTVSPTSLAFGNVQTKTTSAPQTVTVTNGGSAALPLTSITIVGAGASQFSQTNTCGTSVPVGSTCTISALFAPTSAGSKAATLNVVGGSGAGTQSVALTGTADAAAYTVSPASLAFGNVQMETTSAPQTVTVTNGGSAALSITGITLTGANAGAYSQTNTCGAPVPAGSTCAISVVFMPSAAGSQPADLKVTAAGTTHTTALNGTGYVPFTVAPMSLAFGRVAVNTASAPQSVTVTNGGSAALSITGITLTGANPGAYSQTNTCGTFVPVGSTCTISVTFTPISTGNQPAGLKVSAPGVTHVTTLNGSGF